MSGRVFVCEDCGAREEGMPESLILTSLVVREAMEERAARFKAAHAGCAARVARAARRLDDQNRRGAIRTEALGG